MSLSETWSPQARAAALAVRRGQRGREVRAVQRKVGARPDGDFGGKTEAAVRDFQRRHGLTVDGVVGHQTAAAIRGNKNAASVKVGSLTDRDREHLAAAGRRRRSGRRDTAAAAKSATETELRKARERAANRAAANAARQKQGGRAGRRVKAAIRGTLAEAQKPDADGIVWTTPVVVDPSKEDPRAQGAMQTVNEANWQQVTPENRKRIGPIVQHYMKMEHPFTACVNDNTKRFGPDRAKRICAVVKDMGRRTTKWRGKVSEDAMADYFAGRLLEAAGGDVEGLEALMLHRILEG